MWRCLQKVHRWTVSDSVPATGWFRAPGDSQPGMRLPRASMAMRGVGVLGAKLCEQVGGVHRLGQDLELVTEGPGFL
jgi:hypothetical protein